MSGPTDIQSVFAKMQAVIDASAKARDFMRPGREAIAFGFREVKVDRGEVGASYTYQYTDSSRDRIQLVCSWKDVSQSFNIQPDENAFAMVLIGPSGGRTHARHYYSA